MYLESCEIRNFRGLRHLKVSFEQGSTVLIGENAWGKSSLLTALYLMLGQGKICSFEKDDLYVPIDLHFATEVEQDERSSRARERSQRGKAAEKEAGEGGYGGKKAGPAAARAMEEPKAAAKGKSREERRGGDGPSETALRCGLPPLLEDEAEEEGAQSGSDSYELLSEPIRQLFQEDYDFVRGDVFVNEAKYLAVDLIFREPGRGVVDHSRRLQQLNPAWQSSSDGLKRIHWQAVGREKNGVFITEHYLLDRRGQVIGNASTEKILLRLIGMNPVLRVRDSRTMTAELENLPEKVDAQHQELYSFSRQLAELSAEPDVNTAEVVQGLEAMNALAARYLTAYGHRQPPLLSRHRKNRSRSIEDMVTRPISLESLASLKTSLQSGSLTKEKVLAILLTSSLFMAQLELRLDRKAQPILILEDIEARFHPSLLLSFWSVVENIPVQKIVTTNSGDLISAVPLFSLRRLCRQYYDTRCYKVPDKCFNADDLRRIAFHIRLNRPMTLFARCWILVEGETEIWILNEVAAILGLSLPCEGIRMVEFAQCGLNPLMKFAGSLGISFYVLTDGDEAGQRYSQSVSTFVGRRRLQDHLTVLPHLDIEHFFYANGFARVYQDAAGLNAAQRRTLHADKIIESAIHKKSKPGMALAVVNQMQQQGPDSVPQLFRDMLRRILKLAKSEISLD